LQTRTWGRGVVTTYTTNDFGEVGQITYSAGAGLSNVVFSYDAQGRITNVVQGEATQGLALNAAGRVLSEHYTGGPLGGRSRGTPIRA
jgi:YD repeat-containing protein